MADVQDVAKARGGAAPKGKNKTVTLWAVVAGHVPVHLYGQGFLVILPYMAADLGLANVLAGLVETIRRAGGGIASMGGGVVTDRYQHLRGHFLGVSLVLMGLGYLVAGLVSTYVFIVLALGVASAMGSFWHPPAASVLSQSFPDRRGTVMALHRSSGTAGDTVAGLAVGLLLSAGVLWQVILQGTTFLTLLIALPLWAYLWNVGGPRAVVTGGKERGLAAQFRDTGRLFKNRGLLTLLMVAGVRGMGDRGLILFFPFYLKETLQMSPLMVGIHFSLLTVLAIFTGPAIGRLSDSVGRKSVIIAVMLFSAVIAGLMIVVGQGIGFTVLVILMGSVMFSINALTQAGAMDVGEGLRLEGSIMGMYWGVNAIFGAISPLILGTIIDLSGGNFGIVFWYTLSPINHGRPESAGPARRLDLRGWCCG